MLIKKINIKSILSSIGIAVIAVIVASLIRKFILGSLEGKVEWITFYPAVMIAALLGGFFSGVLTSAFAAFIVLFQWQLITNSMFIGGKIGTISTIVFLINCIFISAISEYSRQQKLQADIQKEKAERASRAKSTFLANMSHELRTPLNAILGFTHLMQDNINIPEKEQENLKIINRSGEHLLGLINNVLDISKIEAGQTAKNEISFSIENAIFEVRELMSRHAEAKNLKLKTIFQENLPQYIKTDKQKLIQILINLIGNAIKFTNNGEIILHVKKESRNEQLFLIMEVEDTGIGIDKQELSKIFTPFEQSSNASVQEGTGLGLSISKQYAELLGGSISVESQLGVGSNFFIRIPLIISDTAGLNEITSQFANVKSIAPGQRDFRILIVEDHVENWLLLQRIHEKVGIQVKIAENGLQGVKAFKEWQPHLIWMDVRMPIMNGLEATKSIRSMENGKDVKIIGVSAHVFKDEIHNVMSVGMDSFVKKPYQFQEIYECLNEQLGINFILTENDKNEEQYLLTSEMLKIFDIKLLETLKTAILNLNDEQIDLAISEIQKIDNDVAQVLQSYTKKFKYTELYRSINSTLTDGNK
jgi:signal transduction histidine kinase/DNA-binding response OmpR family regulator